MASAPLLHGLGPQGVILQGGQAADLGPLGVPSSLQGCMGSARVLFRLALAFLSGWAYNLCFGKVLRGRVRQKRRPLFPDASCPQSPFILFPFSALVWFWWSGGSAGLTSDSHEHALRMTSQSLCLALWGLAGLLRVHRGHLSPAVSS